MKRLAVLMVFLMISLLSVPTGNTTLENSYASEFNQDSTFHNFSTLASVEGLGSISDSIAFMTRNISTQSLHIVNSYSNINQHVGELNLLEYYIPSWELYEVSIEVGSITAVAEHERLSVNPNNYINTQNVSGLVYDALYQEFYSQPHDGKLENYTFGALVYPYYPDLGHAYLVVRSDYSDKQTNITSWITPFQQGLSWVTITHECSLDNAILNASTKYYVVIDGTGMEGIYDGQWKFNKIYWRAQYPYLGLETGYHIRDGIWDQYDSGQMREAELNYTYTPWNKTSNNALVYLDPTSVNIRGNTSALSGLTWIFSDEDNIDCIEFDSSQSVEISYTMVLSYRKSVSSPSNWFATESGQDIEWNVSTAIEYPMIAERKFLNLTIPTTWIVSGLYKSSAPSTNHSSYERLQSVIQCSELSNDTWTLISSSRNYLTSIQTYDAENDIEVFTKTSIDSEININSTLTDIDLNPVGTGTTNLTIFHLSSKIWAPNNQSVVTGKSHYLWDISSTTLSNGQYTITEYWCNGTEAGYRTKELVLYYPTSFSASSYQIDAYTDSSFSISVNLTDTFTPQGLDGAYAMVMYSFDGGTNTSLIDLSNGIWTASIDTSGKSSGIYTVRVYAEGYAIENQSLIIDALLIHDTQPLFVQWSNTNNISYVQTTSLLVTYNRVGGIPVTDATVNVTIDGTPYSLHWDGDLSLYRITFNGTDVFPGFGAFNLEIEAWREGYREQSDTTQTLTIHKEYTSLTFSWLNGDVITYVQDSMLIVNYTMSDGQPVLDAIVNVTIDTTPWELHWNPISKLYYLTVNGSDVLPGLGTHSINIAAGKFGFENHSNSTTSFTINIESTSLTIKWSSDYNITFVQQTTLIVSYNMSDGSPIEGAMVNVTISGYPSWNLIWDGSESYILIFNGSDLPPGFGTHKLTIKADKYGFANKENIDEDLILRPEPTTIDTQWIGPSTITYVESTIISINYTMSNGTPISGAIVYITIGVSTWNLTWDGGTQTYRWEFSGSDAPPGLGTHSLAINASRYGFITVFDNDSLTIENEATTLIVQWIPTNETTYMGRCVLTVNYIMNNNNSAISDAIVNATVAGVLKPMVWNSTAQKFYLYIEGSEDLPALGSFTVIIHASRLGFEAVLDPTERVTLVEEPTSLYVYWANGVNNPGFYEYTYLIAEYNYDNDEPVVLEYINATVNSRTWLMYWNESAEYYQLRFNGSDVYPGVGTYTVIVQAWSYGFGYQTNNDEELIIPVIPTKLTITWTNGDNITYVEDTTLQVFYMMYNDTWILDAVVNVTINSVTWNLTWNSQSHAYEGTFSGSDSSLDFMTYSLVINASKSDFQYQSNNTETLTIGLEPTSLVIFWTNGNNITYYSTTILSVQYIMSNSTPITTGMLNVTIDGTLWDLVWNSTSNAYEREFRGNDSSFYFDTFDVLINASGYGYLPSVDLEEKFTIRREDTTISFEWVPSDTITYLETTILRIYYRLESGAAVLGATVNVTYVLTWPANWNEAEKAYEVVFTGDTFPIPVIGPHTLLAQAWKSNYLSQIDISQSITFNQEATTLHAIWLDGNNTITFTESATIHINYSISDGSPVEDAYVTIRIGTDIWEATYDSDLHLYVFTFTGNMDPPGLGTHRLYISSTYILHEGYKDAEYNLETLRILSESVMIDCYWIGGDNISYVESTILVVNYTTSDGTPIALATVNVTIDTTMFWELHWHSLSETYRLVFNGFDSLPGFGTHELKIKAERFGFVGLTDNYLNLHINEEITTLIPRWSSPNQNNVSYFEYTYLFVDYLMSNSSPILGASVNVTIEIETWNLLWNATEGSYGICFNGSDIPPGFGTYTVVVDAKKYGFKIAHNTSEYLTLTKDPTTIQVTWSNGNSITFIESTTLTVYYRMSNGTSISTGILNVTIGFDNWSLIWNGSIGGYQYKFYGNMNPPGLGNYSMSILASGDVYSSQFATTTLAVDEEPTLAIASWLTDTIDWTESIILEIEYRDSHGSLIENATLKTISINGTLYVLHGTNGVYWFEFNNSFNLGNHVVVVNISKYGYQFAVNASIEFNIIEAITNLDLDWNSITIDYLGQIDLTANYFYVLTGQAVPTGVNINISIDGTTPIPLLSSGDLWYFNLTGINLDLGEHTVIIRADAYGYTYAEALETLMVSEVITDQLSVIWDPSNVTIEYTGVLTLVVDYTYYGGDVPDTAIVNMTIDTHIYNLTYSSNAWRISISGNELGIGYYEATISAWLYGYTHRANLTLGVNVTLAANSFIVTWEPGNLQPSYTDTVNLTVIYTEDFQPIVGATVRLSINGTVYDLVYNSIDKKWHFSILASEIDLGTWNVTVTANMTGYSDGWYSNILTVIQESTTLSVLPSTSTFYFDENELADIYYRMSNLSIIQGAICVVTLEEVTQSVVWSTDHWVLNIEGQDLGVGIHTFNITTLAYGYSTHSYMLEITILLIPTIVVNPEPLVMFARESTSIRFTFLDTRTNSGISGALSSIDWISTSNVIDLGNGTYIVEIGGGSVHTGSYTLNILLECAGYDNGTGQVIIDVMPIPTQIEFTSQISQYENETILITIKLADTNNMIPIDWANVKVVLNSVEYSLVYSAGSQNYSTSIWLSTFVPGTYNLSLEVIASDCETQIAYIDLVILEKATYTISVSAVEEIQTGEVLLVTATVHQQSTPVSGIQLVFSITVITEDGSRITIMGASTSSDGVATIEFTVPLDAIALDIVVQYNGSLSTWLALSSPRHIAITAPNSGILDIILNNPVMIAVIAGGVSFPLLAIALMKRKRGPGIVDVSSPVTTPNVSPVESISLTDPINRARQEILNSDTGLTRAEISERLGLSSSKTGSIVKDLLESDSSLEEVRQGSKRLIKKKD
ncbi:MAG: hypothetical protein JW779_06730 [Candidatus Thorarchaeota archaeon]|nr:hypothetical protein [Candidatus Thorarchaeota archaeon]